MARAFADIAFTPAVRTLQTKMGSADAYARFLQDDVAPPDELGSQEAAFIAARDGFYQASVSQTGWPYVQFRGGAAGFVKVLTSRTLAYADFRGNRQYISAGNLTVNDRVSLILMDYPNQQRLKLWGRARLVDAAQDPALLEQLHDPACPAHAERAVVITIDAFDWNCPRHIPRRYTADEAIEEIATLRRENAALRAKICAPRSAR